MKTSYYLVTAAVVAAAAVTVFAQLPPPPPGPTTLPQIDLPPVSFPPDLPAPPRPPAASQPVPVAPLPKPVATKPAPLPVVPPPSSIPALPVPTAPALPPVTFSTPVVTPTPTLPPISTPPLAVTPPALPPISAPPPVTIAPPSTVTPPTPLPVVLPPVTIAPPVIAPPAVLEQPAKPLLPPVTIAPPVVQEVPAKPLAPPVVVAPPVVQEPPAKPLLPPPAPLPAPTPVAEQPKGPGKYLVTADAKLVEGVVTKSGTGFVVRRGSLDEPYAKEKVLFVGYTKDEVYQFMLGRVDAKDVETRLKLARWCVFNGMRSQGLTEANAILKLQPASTAAADMVRSLEESLKKFPEEGVPAAKPEVPAPALIPPAVQEAEIDVTPDGAVSFATKAQPLLANLCADCHAKPTYAGSFKMARSTAYDTTAATARLNLRAAAGQLKKDDPSNSPLLVKAVTPHGGQKEPAIASRQAAAFRNLEAWVSVAVGADALLMRPTPAPAVVPVAAPVMPPVAPVAPTGGFGVEVKPDPKPTAPNPANTGTAVDEFDPSVFNKAVRPAMPQK